MAFDQSIADKVLELLGDGKGSLRGVCREVGLKHSTWLLWCSERAELADQYTRARAIGRAIRFEALNEKAAEEPERDERGRIDPGWIQWKRLQIDAEKWTLSKEEPRKYGDKLELAGDKDNPLTVVVRKLTDQAKP